MTTKKYHIMPIILNLTPPTLTLPYTKPMVQRQEAVGGFIKWAVAEWNQKEYEQLQNKVNTIVATSTGIRIEDFVTKLAKAVSETMPGRDFAVQLGSFGIEHKEIKRQVAVK